MRIGVVGGGITGLTIAFDLLKSGCDVTVFEKNRQLGGLAGAIEIGENRIERFYHHFFKTDEDLIALLEELDLGERIVWQESQIGYCHGNRIYKFGKPIDLLSFKPLNLINKIKFATSVYYFQKKSAWDDLGNISIRDWFAKNRSLKVYEVVWEPLLKLKFGDEYKNIAAAWLWGRVNPRAKSRERIYKNEKLGYLQGSFEILFERFQKRITDLGGKVLTGNRVKSIEPLDNGGLRLHCEDEDLTFDKVVAAIHNPTFIELLPGLPSDYRKKLEGVRYQAVICMIFAMDTSLTRDIYWLNINNPEIPFGGVIEHTNFISPDAYNGLHLAYIFNYLPADAPIFQLDKEELLGIYIEGLKKIFVNFSEECIKDTFLSRDRFASPVYTLDYQNIMPRHETPIPNVFLANTSQVYPEDRNMNNCVRNAMSLTELIKTKTADGN